MDQIASSCRNASADELIGLEEKPGIGKMDRRLLRRIKTGVIIHLYQGEKGLGKLHAKGMIADDKYASIGSCNFDTMSLRGNYEQNVVSRDPEFVAKVRRDLFEKDFTVSILYQPPASWWDRLKLKVMGGASQLLDRFD